MFLTYKLSTHTKLNFKKNRTICIKMNLALNNLQRLICHKTQQIRNPQWRSQLLLSHLWTNRPHPKDTSIFRPYKMKGEHKSGPVPYRMISFSWGRGAPIPPTSHPPDWPSVINATHPECGYQPNEKR